MNNANFATAIHIVTLLATTNDNLSSSYMAGSMNVNPVVVRKSLSILVAYGLIETKEGKGGGASLAKPASQILLSDIYSAVNDSHLLGKLNNPNPACDTGRQINEHLLNLFKEADQSLISKLGSITLADFCKQFN